jgi:putative transposase
MYLNQAGHSIDTIWRRIPSKFNGVNSDHYVVMPNHFHAIVPLIGANTYIFTTGIEPRVSAVGVDPCVYPQEKDFSISPAEGDTHKGVSLPEIVQWFKTMTTNEYIKGVNWLGWPAFEKRIWQKNYYEHIIRTERDLNDARQYIIDNPANWRKDPENPNQSK